MEKANKNDDEKKESFLKKHWGNIKKVASTLYFIVIYFIIFYLLLGDLNFSGLKDCILLVIFAIIGFIFAWLSGCEYLKRINIHRFIINLIFIAEFLFVLVILGYLLEKIFGINYFLIIIFIILYLLKKYKKKYIKILHSKVGLSLFFIAFSMIINICLYKYLPKFCIWLISDIFKSSDALVKDLFYSILCIIISGLFLKCLYNSTNKNSEEGTGYRFILDLIFIFELFILFSYIVNFLLFDINKYLIEIDINIWRDFFFYLLVLFVSLYVLNSCMRNILKIKSTYFIIAFIALFLLGNISIEYFIIVQLFVTIVNYFLDNTKYIYGNFFRKLDKNMKNFDYELINDDITKEKNCYRKIWFNIGIFLLWIYLYIFEKIIPLNSYYLLDKLFGFSLINSETEKEFLGVTGWLMNYISREANRIFFLCVIIIIFGIIFGFILTLYLFIKSKFNIPLFMIERDKFYTKIECFPMNFVRKFVYYKKYVDIKKHKSIKTNIKTSIHINSRKKFHRIYKYKNIEFHNKKPNSN